jgi:hypothetical protein
MSGLRNVVILERCKSVVRRTNGKCADHESWKNEELAAHGRSDANAVKLTRVLLSEAIVLSLPTVLLDSEHCARECAACRTAKILQSSRSKDRCRSWRRASAKVSSWAVRTHRRSTSRRLRGSPKRTRTIDSPKHSGTSRTWGLWLWLRTPERGRTAIGASRAAYGEVARANSVINA